MMRFFLSSDTNTPIMTWLSEELCRLGHKCCGGIIRGGADVPDFYNAIDHCTLIKDRLLADRSLFAEAFAGIKPAVLSAADMEYFTEAWVDYCRITDRWYLGKRSMNAHLLYFRDILRYAVGLIDQLGIDAILFTHIPHITYTNILYHAARLRGCAVITFRYTYQALEVRGEWSKDYSTIPDKKFNPATPSPEQEDFLRIQMEYLQPTQVEDPKLFSKIRQFNYFAHNEKIPDGFSMGLQVRALNSAILERHSRAWYVAIPYDAAYIFKEILYHLRIKRRYRYYRGGRINLPLTDWPRWTSFWLTMRNFFDAKKMYKEYCSLASAPDFGKPYIYMALHVQPESSTVPQGGCFVDQYLEAVNIASALPEGWELYIKEHPVQFRERYPDLGILSSYTGRYPGYYRELAGLQGVRLIPPDVPSADLIDNAKLCATVTGTIGAEALRSGKPVMTFGYAWYDSCTGCIRVGSESEVASAIERLLKIDPEEISRSFLQVMVGVGKNTSAIMPEGYTMDSRLDSITRQKFGNTVVSVAKKIDALWIRHDDEKRNLR